jgi:hypothetical protein
VPALPSWLTTPLWDQFRALLPDRGTYDPDHPLGCHRRRVADRVVFDKLVQVLTLLAKSGGDQAAVRPWAVHSWWMRVGRRAGWGLVLK